MDLADLRRDVALANRIVHAAGLVSAFGHVSARVPDTDSFLFPRRASPALAHPERLLVLDLDGNRREGQGEPNTEFWIHARIYAARPDVGAVAHVHSPACVVLAQIGQELKLLHNSAGVFADGVPLFERIGLIRTRELGDQVAATLGPRRAMLLRGHGANVAETDVRRAAVVACFLEEAADLQLRALAAAGGRVDALRAFTPEEALRIREQIDARGPMSRAWEYYASLAEGTLSSAATAEASASQPEATTAAVRE
jgi:ribulose-5-phosphate 4-epimerase/fuculose-1-phosphate aldolase